MSDAPFELIAVELERPDVALVMEPIDVDEIVDIRFSFPDSSNEADTESV